MTLKAGAWYWCDTGWACGAVVVDERGVIVDCAPIFRRRWLGRPLRTLPAKTLTKLTELTPRPERR